MYIKFKYMDIIYQGHTIVTEGKDFIERREKENILENRRIGIRDMEDVSRKRSYFILVSLCAPPTLEDGTPIFYDDDGDLEEGHDDGTRWIYVPHLRVGRIKDSDTYILKLSG